MVGRCFENGWGAPVIRSCRREYRASAAGGHDWGEYNFGNMLFDGRGVACDRRPALVSACGFPGPRACDESARPLSRGGLGLRPERRGRRVLVLPVGAARIFRGQFNYAAVLAQHGHAAAAAIWYLKAAAGGDRADAPGHHFGACERSSSRAAPGPRARPRALGRVAERIGTVTARAEKRNNLGQRDPPGPNREKLPCRLARGSCTVRWRDSRDQKPWALESIGFVRRIHLHRSARILS